MTKATTEGRQLVLIADGADRPFKVDPIPALRGSELTEKFLDITLSEVPDSGRQRPSNLSAESIFVESFGPENYSRALGMYVDLVDYSDPEQVDGVVVATYTADGAVWADDAHRSLYYYTGSGCLLRPRRALPGEEYLEPENLRQHEVEALALCAFYWQTVVGMEAVEAFIAQGEDTIASVKCLTLLRTRSRPLQRMTFQGSERPQQSGAETPSIGSGSATVRLPANRKSINQNPAKRKDRGR